jgi:hypothetical protein
MEGCATASRRNLRRNRVGRGRRHEHEQRQRDKAQRQIGDRTRKRDQQILLHGARPAAETHETAGHVDFDARDLHAIVRRHHRVGELVDQDREKEHRDEKPREHKPAQAEHAKKRNGQDHRSDEKRRRENHRRAAVTADLERTRIEGKSH